MDEWFRRLAEIPGVGYETSPAIDRRRLPGHDAKPVVTDVFKIEGRRHEVIVWQGDSWSSSQSPARERAFVPLEDLTPDAQLRNLNEALELPGEPTDYHFAIQSSAAALWKQGREDPALLLKAEELFWLDIRLIEARPQAITYESGNGDAFYAVAGFHSLISMYEREGYVREALEVARRGERFNPVSAARERLEGKLFQIEAEDAA